MSESYDIPNVSSAKEEAIDDDYEENTCEECSDRFREARQLYRHLFDAHGYSKLQLDQVKVKRRNMKTKKKACRSSKSIYNCDVCDRPYLSKLGLAKHKESQHGQVKVTYHAIDNIVCPLEGCRMRFQTYYDLAVHCDCSHRDMVINPESYAIIRMTFSSFDKFTQWKARQELETDSRFYIRSTETKIRYGKKVWLLKCNDIYRKRGPNVGPFAADHCPAFIRVCERFNGDVEAVACFGHAGHVHGTNTHAAVREIHLRRKMAVEGTIERTDEPNDDLDGVDVKRQRLDDSIDYEEESNEADVSGTYRENNNLCYWTTDRSGFSSHPHQQGSISLSKSNNC